MGVQAYGAGKWGWMCARGQVSAVAGVRCWQVGVGVCERSGKCGCRGQASGGAGVRCWQATLSARGQASGDVV